MKWYYSANREKFGPIDELAFEHLVAAGVIADQTLVWRKGMPEWRPYGEVKSIPVAPVAAPPPPPPARAAGDEAPGVTCKSCGAFLLRDNTVRFRDDYVCLECREEFVRKQDEERQAAQCDSDDEEERRTGLQHERRLRTVAGLYYVLGGILSVVAVLTLLNGKPGITFICLLLGVPTLFAARELMNFRRRAKVAACCVSGLGLILVPLGTLLHLYLLYLLCNKHGKRVLSQEYREVISRTPHLKPGISWVGVVLLCVLQFLAVAILSK